MNNQRQRLKRKKRQKLFWSSVTIVCSVAFLGLLIAILIKGHMQEERRLEEQTAHDVFDEINVEVVEDHPIFDNVTEQPLQITDRSAELLMQNPDYVGLLAFGDVSLYVCQTDDNSYYASHRFDGTEDPAGMIYMDFRCSAWPLGENTILYGHNMRDGSRFGKLNRLTKWNYLVENDTVRFADLYGIHDYVPIAALYVSVNPESPDYLAFDRISFSGQEEFDQYIKEIAERSVLSLPRSAEYGDSLLTLATCSERYDGGRLVIICVEL